MSTKLERALEESNALLRDVITGKHAGSKEVTLCHRRIALNEAVLAECSLKVKHTPYQYVSADHKDIDGFMADLLDTLNKMGIHATMDPVLEDTDHIGIILSKEPLQAKLLHKNIIKGWRIKEWTTYKDFLKQLNGKKEYATIQR